MKASLPEKNNKDLRIAEAPLWGCSLRDCKKTITIRKRGFLMKLRKLFAGAAAAATLLGGMAFGATTANAAEANISSTTITVNATDANQFYTKPVDTADLQANLRMFKYVELAKYVSDGNTGVELEGLVSGEAVDAAFAAAGYNDQTKGDSLNEWAWLGNTTLTAAQTTAFVNALKDLAVTDITPTASNGGKTQTFTFAEGGLYLIVDQSGKLVVEDNDTHKLVWNGNAPILAGTAITGAAPSVNNATGVLAAAGVVDLKSSKEETTKAGAVTWQKVDKNAAALTGAEFQVYEGDVSGLSADELKAKTPLKFNGSNGAYSLPTANADGTYPEGATDTLQSNAEGKYTLNGLKLNTIYTVIETKVPTGYNGTFVGKFTITTGATADAAATFACKDAWNLSKDNKGTFQVTNVKNITQLPLTGAAGTMLFSVIGLLIAGAAVTVFVKSRSTKRALNA